jgi:hypothetical protein
MYARVIEYAGSDNLGYFMKQHIDRNAKVTTYMYKGYAPWSKYFESHTIIYSGKKSGNFPELHRSIINLKG